MNTAGDLRFIDIHCHLLPGVDDGPTDWEGSLALARRAVAEGIGTVIATPHQLGRYPANTAPRLRQLTAEVRRRLAEAQIDLTVLPGADVRVQENLPRLVAAGEVLTLADRKTHLLLELPHDQCLPLGTLIYQLACQGVGCILSHPERHGALMKHPSRLRAWVHQGCLVQITSASITGQFGRDVQKASRWLVREGLVHLVATDAHDVESRPPLMREAYARVRRWANAETAQKLFMINPLVVIRGWDVASPLPLARSRCGLRTWWDTALAALSHNRGA